MIDWGAVVPILLRRTRACNGRAAAVLSVVILKIAGDHLLVRFLGAAEEDKVRQIQVVDSVHTGPMSIRRYSRAARAGQPPRTAERRRGKGEAPQDGAGWGVVEREVRYLGYTSHVSLNAEAGLITTVRPLLTQVRFRPPSRKDQLALA